MSHAPNCNISEHLSDVCSCGQTPTTPTPESELVARLRAKADAAERSLRLANTVHEEHLQRARREGIEMAAKVAEETTDEVLIVYPRGPGDPPGNQMVQVRGQLVIASRIRALSSAPPPEKGERIPSGWKLVPVEPTAEILAAARKASREVGPLGNWLGESQSAPIYKAMLAASPPPAPDAMARIAELESDLAGMDDLLAYHLKEHRRLTDEIDALHARHTGEK